MEHLEVLPGHYKCSALAQKLLNQVLSEEAWSLKQTPQVERYLRQRKRVKGRRGGRKEPWLAPVSLFYLGKTKAVQLFLQGLEKVVVIDSDLTHLRAGQIAFIPN